MVPSKQEQDKSCDNPPKPKRACDVLNLSDKVKKKNDNLLKGECL
jgi:hypothetical protein